jgi:hypothetical protein
MSLMPGRRLGPCEILDPLGTGGMGEVYPGCGFGSARTPASPCGQVSFLISFRSHT